MPTEIRCSTARAVTAADVWAHAPWGPRVSGSNCTCSTAPDPCPEEKRGSQLHGRPDGRGAMTMRAATAAATGFFSSPSSVSPRRFSSSSPPASLSAGRCIRRHRLRAFPSTATPPFLSFFLSVSRFLNEQILSSHPIFLGFIAGSELPLEELNPSVDLLVRSFPLSPCPPPRHVFLSL